MEVFFVLVQERFIECLIRNDLDPDSQEVIEWLEFKPESECLHQDVLANYDDVLDADLDVALVKNTNHVTQVVCMAVWSETEAGPAAPVADSIYICPILPNTTVPEDNDQVM